MHRRERSVNDESENSGGDVKIVVWEWIGLFIIAETIWFAHEDQVCSVNANYYEDDFHEEQIKGFPPHKYIHVSGQKNHNINLLSFVRQSYTPIMHTYNIAVGEDFP